MKRELIKENSGYYRKWTLSKRCPFCGDIAVIDEYSEAQPYEPSYYYAGEELYCIGCGVMFRKECNSDRDSRLNARNELSKKWNKRANSLSKSSNL